MEPRTVVDLKPDSPQSSSSSESDLSSPSFNRDSEFDFATQVKDVIEAQPNRDNILAMAPISGSFENESDSNSTATAKTVLSSQTTAKDNMSLGSSESEKRSKVSPKPV